MHTIIGKNSRYQLRIVELDNYILIEDLDAFYVKLSKNNISDLIDILTRIKGY